MALLTGCSGSDSTPDTPTAIGETDSASRSPADQASGSTETESPSPDSADPLSPVANVLPANPVRTQPASDLPGEMAPPPSQASEPIQLLLATARAAMAERDILTARRQLDAARSQQLSPADRAEVERMWLLYQSWVRFWAAVRESKAKLAAGAEIELDGETLEIVQVGDDQVTLKPSEGEARTLVLPNLSMPAGLAVALARRSLTGPLADREVAVFHLMDREGDAKEAARLCQELYQRGVNVDLLLPELP